MAASFPRESNERGERGAGGREREKCNAFYDLVTQCHFHHTLHLKQVTLSNPHSREKDLDLPLAERHIKESADIL